VKCPRCSGDGYYYTEKLRISRPKRIRPTVTRYNIHTRKTETYQYEPYRSVRREKNRYRYFIHNTKKDGKWSTKRCYVGRAGYEIYPRALSKVGIKAEQEYYDTLYSWKPS